MPYYFLGYVKAIINLGSILGQDFYEAWVESGKETNSQKTNFYSNLDDNDYNHYSVNEDESLKEEIQNEGFTIIQNFESQEEEVPFQERQDLKFNQSFETKEEVKTSNLSRPILRLDNDFNKLIVKPKTREEDLNSTFSVVDPFPNQNSFSPSSKSLSTNGKVFIFSTLSVLILFWNQSKFSLKKVLQKRFSKKKNNTSFTNKESLDNESI